MTKYLTILILTSSILGYGQHSGKFEFEKIIFHTSFCFGTCPTYHLQIDKDRNMKLFAEEVFKEYSYNKDTANVGPEKDTAQMGFFIGTINTTSFDKLKNKLQKIGLDTLEIDGPYCCDGILRTIIVYYNGQRKYFKSMFPPAKIYDLISTLEEICETRKLQKTYNGFIIEE